MLKKCIHDLIKVEHTRHKKTKNKTHQYNLPTNDVCMFVSTVFGVDSTDILSLNMLSISSKSLGFSSFIIVEIKLYIAVLNLFG